MAPFSEHRRLFRAGQTPGKPAVLSGEKNPAESVAGEIGGLHPALWAALRRASLRACLKLAESSARGRTAEELAAYMIPLAESVWRTAQGQQVSRETTLPALPVSTLLETLRTELLEEFRSDGTPAQTRDVVLLLQAIDALCENTNADPAHRFASRFIGSAGLDALVEVAHDMRSPLASIVLLVETIRQGNSGPVTQTQERQLGLLYAASFGLSLLVNDVISLARGGDRLMEAESQAFSLREALNSVAEIVLPISEEKGIELRITSPDGDWRVGYPSTLHRVMLNLATNALKFTDKGCVEIGATARSRSTVELYVRDTGNGIPLYLMPTLFEAFRTQDERGVATFSGSGLGLATCRKLVNAMGGEIFAENLAEGGSRFYFTVELPPAPRV